MLIGKISEAMETLVFILLVGAGIYNFTVSFLSVNVGLHQIIPISNNFLMVKLNTVVFMSTFLIEFPKNFSVNYTGAIAITTNLN